MKAYLHKPQSERSNGIPVGVFSSRKENSLPCEVGGRDPNSVNITLTSEERELFAHLLKKRLAIYPYALSVYRVAKIIGYSERTIRWHIAKGKLFATLQERKHLVSKYSLIKFLASDKGFAMQPKSEWHEKAIRWFIEVMYK